MSVLIRETHIRTYRGGVFALRTHIATMIIPFFDQHSPNIFYFAPQLKSSDPLPAGVDAEREMYATISSGLTGLGRPYRPWKCHRDKAGEDARPF